MVSKKHARGNVDWKERASGVDKLASFAATHPEVNRSKKFMGIVDAFSKGMSDNNSKVLFAAQRAFLKSITQIHVLS